MTGSNLPPGCTHRHIEEAFGGRDPTEQEEQAQAALEFLFDSGFATQETRQERVDLVANIVTKLTDDLAEALAQKDETVGYLRAGLHEIGSQPASVGGTYIRELATKILNGTWQPDDYADSAPPKDQA